MTPPARPLTRRALLRSLAAGAALALIPGLAGCTPTPSLASLNIVPRDDWGAVEPDIVGSAEGAYDPVHNPGGWYSYEGSLQKALNTLVVHHSAMALSDGPLEIQRKHMRTRGFADIAYHFVIDDTGRIYEGRSLAVRGTHTGGHNTGTVGVVLMGNFEHMTPTEAQMASLLALSRALIAEYRLTHLAGHRDFQPDATVCPGENLAVLLPDLVRGLGISYGIGGYVGPP